MLPMGRLPKAVVSTMNGSATGSYVCLTGGLVDQGLAAFTVGVGCAASCGRATGYWSVGYYCRFSRLI